MLTGSGNLALYVMKLRKKTWCVRSSEPDTLPTRCSADVFYDVANNLLPGLTEKSMYSEIRYFNISIHVNGV